MGIHVHIHVPSGPPSRPALPHTIYTNKYKPNPKNVRRRAPPDLSGDSQCRSQRMQVTRYNVNVQRIYCLQAELVEYLEHLVGVGANSSLEAAGEVHRPLRILTRDALHSASGPGVGKPRSTLNIIPVSDTGPHGSGHSVW